jgi:nucleotide-binding universal stress UspA family protein
MFKHVLIPLDGSKLAEAALPAAAFVAKNMGASVTLIHIIEKNAPAEIHGEAHLRDPQEALAYLDSVARAAFPPSVRVSTHVHTEEESNIPRSIVDHAGEYDPDLIILCSHGSGGLRDLLFGSIAQQVINAGATPVMIIHPRSSGEAQTFNCQQLLVPVDAEAGHEQGIETAAGLARHCAMKMQLLAVIPTLGTLPGEHAATGILLPAATRAMLEIAEENAREYLAGWIKRLRADDIAVSVQVERGDPAQVIVAASRATGADLIVLGTHGKSGQDAFWAGSVAPKVASQVHVPLLLVPVKEG